MPGLGPSLLPNAPEAVEQTSQVKVDLGLKARYFAVGKADEQSSNREAIGAVVFRLANFRIGLPDRRALVPIVDKSPKDAILLACPGCLSP